MKKIIALLLASLIAVCLLSACGGKSVEKQLIGKWSIDLVESEESISGHAGHNVRVIYSFRDGGTFKATKTCLDDHNEEFNGWSGTWEISDSGTITTSVSSLGSTSFYSYTLTSDANGTYLTDVDNENRILTKIE